MPRSHEPDDPEPDAKEADKNRRQDLTDDEINDVFKFMAAKRAEAVADVALAHKEFSIGVRGCENTFLRKGLPMDGIRGQSGNDGKDFCKIYQLIPSKTYSCTEHAYPEELYRKMAKRLVS
jgi:hypothetical protein